MNTQPDYTNYENVRIPADLAQALCTLRTILGNTMDLNIMEVLISKKKCAVVTIENMLSTSSMSELVFRPLMALQLPENACGMNIYKYLAEESLLACERKTVTTYGETILRLFSGFAVIFIDTVPKAVAYGIQGYDKRSISEPTNGQTVRGSQDSFIEAIRTNISLCRRRIKNPALRFEMTQIGEKSHTDVCMVYMEGRASPEIVDKIRKRLSHIKLDTILSSGYIEPFLDDNYNRSFFNAATASERPDVLCMKVNEGRVGILIDGTPFCLICPSLFIENFQTIDDYVSKPYYATFIRWIKYISFFLATVFPGIYVAIAVFHSEIFAFKLLINLSAAEEATQFPLVVEVLIITLLLEIMREAGIRLPKAVGSAVSIVGGLIVGDAAVKCGIISAPLLILVGLTATSSFVIPSLNEQTSVLRLIFIFAGGLAGFFGIAVCIMLVIANICAMDDFYIPYTAPVTPFSLKGIKDVVSRRKFTSYQKTHSTVEEYSDTE